MAVTRVLVADDHPTFRSGVRAVLDATADIEVVGEADDGDSAVLLAIEHRPDVVLLDILMPGVGGVEACRRIVESTEARVVVLTMSSGDDTIFASLRAGALGYLVKNARPADIIAAVRAARDGHALLGGGVAERVSAFFTSPQATAAQPFPQLTEREREVLELMARGKTNATIAEELFLGRKTVRNYVSQILSKLSARDRADAMEKALEVGFGERPG